MKTFEFDGTNFNTLADAQNAAYATALSIFNNATEDFRGNPVSFDKPHYNKALSMEEAEYYDNQLNDLINTFFDQINVIEPKNEHTLKSNITTKRNGEKTMRKFCFDGNYYDTITDAQNAAYLTALDFYGATNDFEVNPFYDPHYYKPLSNEEVEYYDRDLNNLIDFFFGLIIEIDTPVNTAKNVA